MSTSKKFRLFISSTFNDFRKEREVLQTKVFPHIKEYATERGYSFQPIDLRWGVSDEAQLDQKTLELCLSEVRACKTHLHPNFLIMIGDRYGWVPLPFAIEVEEFEELYSLAPDDAKTLLNTWYKKDLNQIPASYILQERRDEFVDYNLWEKVEEELRNIVHFSVYNSSLSEEQKRKYFLSATEAEVEEGIIPYLNPTKFQTETLLKEDSTLLDMDKEHIFAFFKSSGVSSKEVDEFKERVQNTLVDANTLEVNENSIKYLSEFETRMIEFLEMQIDEQKEEESQSAFSALEVELAAQNYFALSKRRNFLAQEELRKTITDYILNNDQETLVIYGKSGTGKSALMAKAIEESETRLQQKVLYRFVGATANSNSSKEILTSLFDELGKDIRSKTQEESFQDFCQRVKNEIDKIDECIVIFIDAVDQLQNDDLFLWLPKELPSNIKIVLSVLEDDAYKEDSKYLELLRKRTSNLHIVSAFNEPAQLLKSLLKQENRAVDIFQENYFLQQYKNVESPLYVTIAAQEMKNWKSGETTQTLENTQKKIIKEFILNLTKSYHHNREFVQKVLGFIYASRDGLSENELLQLLSQDEKFIEKMAPETFHTNKLKELPLIHWSRLHTQLQPFLSTKTIDGEELMYFFHREFEDAVKEQLDQKEEHENIINATQTIILKNKDKDFYENRWGRLYIHLITEYELRYGNKLKHKEYAIFLTDTKMLEEEWIEKCINKISSIGLEFYRQNNMYKSIAYLESSRFIAEELNTNNSPKWVEKYIGVLTNLANAYSAQNRKDEAKELRKISLEIRELLYKVNQEKWVGSYIMGLLSLANSYLDEDYKDLAIELNEKSLMIIEPLYTKNQQKWVQDYIVILNNLGSAYFRENKKYSALELWEKSLKILEPLYEKNPKKWVEDYTRILGNLSASYRIEKRENEASELNVKSLEILDVLYNENPERWSENYTIALGHLAIAYSSENREEEAILLREKSVKIRETLYRENPERWSEDYTLALKSLAVSYKKQGCLDEKISLEESSLKQVETVYTENPRKSVEEYIISFKRISVFYKQVDKRENVNIGEEKKFLEMIERHYSENKKQWVEVYLSALKHLTWSYYWDLKDIDYLNAKLAFQALDLTETRLEILKELHNDDSKRWQKEYKYATEDNKEYRNICTIVIARKQLKLAKNFYKKEPERLTGDFSTLYEELINLCLGIVSFQAEAVVYAEENLEMHKRFYKKDAQKWIESYALAFNNLVRAYKNFGKYDDVKRVRVESFKIATILYKKSPNDARWEELYSNAVESLPAVLSYFIYKYERVYSRIKDFKDSGYFSRTYFSLKDYFNSEYKLQRRFIWGVVILIIGSSLYGLWNGITALIS